MKPKILKKGSFMTGSQEQKMVMDVNLFFSGLPLCHTVLSSFMTTHIILTFHHDYIDIEASAVL